MNKKKTISFGKRDFVVYPSHGVGQIKTIEKLKIAGTMMELLVIYFKKDKMTLRIPMSKVRSVGIRCLASNAEITRVMTILKGRPRVKRMMWSRRAQEYEQKINSGNVIAIGEVVRDLHRGDKQRDQSYSERQLYEIAFERLTREIAVVQGLSETDTSKKLMHVLNARFTASETK